MASVTTPSTPAVSVASSADGSPMLIFSGLTVNGLLDPMIR